MISDRSGRKVLTPVSVYEAHDDSKSSMARSVLLTILVAVSISLILNLWNVAWDIESCFKSTYILLLVLANYSSVVVSSIV